MLQFFNAPNLLTAELTEAAPWEFAPTPEALAEVRAMKKNKRREWIVQPATRWNVYTAMRGVNRRQRVGKENAPGALCGLVVDYDHMTMEIEAVRKLLGNIKEPKFVPNFIEKSLGGNARLVWVFEREILIPNTAFANLLLKTLIDKLRADKLLPGYDAASEKPAEVWTNGGEWHVVNETPMPWETTFGIVCAVSAKSESASSEIPLPIIHGEVERRFPKRWKGPFELHNTGVRFWDDLADCLTGCQVKPDGMLCFTGKVGFMNWEQIFGAEWCDSQRATNLGKEAGETYFDGRHYWQEQGIKWHTVQREDLLLSLRTRGLSTKPKRGQTVSDADRVLHHIQKVNRVDGAAPLIARPSGLVTMDGNRILNTNCLRALVPAEGDASPETHFPWLWRYVNHLFVRPDLRPVDYWLAWMRRFYLSIYERVPYMGQAVFLCGPRENGKTLLGYRVIKPLVGDRSANPYDFFTGQTAWNDELLSSPLLMINDEDAPTRDETRQKLIARLKSFVVNPSHMHQARFQSRVNVEWTGRIFITLNDDPGSAGLLPFVHHNTHDKMMFFGSQPRPKDEPWEENRVTEKRITQELPYFAKWLMNWTPPEHVRAAGRMGVKSFYDPAILTLAQQEDPSQNLLEVLNAWIEQSPYWGEDKHQVETWEGTAYDFLGQLSTTETLNHSLREWNTGRVARAFQSLARGDTPGITFAGNGGRRFRVHRAQVLEYIRTNEQERKR